MPTVLLQEIRDLLTAFLTAINQKIEALLDKVSNIDENVDDIKDDVHDIKGDVHDIKEDCDHIPSIDISTQSIDTKLTNTNLKLDTANGYLSDIKDNTGSLVTPVGQIKNNTDILAANSTPMKNDIHDISQYMNVISTNTGKCAAFTEDTATNTQDIYDKIVTMASDTTQIRANGATIIAILNQIYDKL